MPKTTQKSKSTPAKPTLKSLQAEIQQARADLASVQQRLIDRDAEVVGLKKSQKEYESAQSTATTQLATARAALKPFLAKTGQWTWPDPNILALAPLTFGDLKAARDAAEKIGDA